MRWRWILTGAGVVAVAAALAVGLTQAGGSKAPGNAAALVEHPGKLVDGDIRARVKALRGRPVVVNEWASWCDPCKREFPLFQKLGVEMGKRVAFLGLNTLDDNEARARRFLAKFPVPYPSYRDPDGKGARSLGPQGGLPLTLFFRPDGELELAHQGAYDSLADLRRDVLRYAVGEK